MVVWSFQIFVRIGPFHERLKMSTIGLSQLEIPLGNGGSKAMGVEINLLMKPNGTNSESDHEARWSCEANLCAATRLEFYAAAVARSVDDFYTTGSLDSLFTGTGHEFPLRQVPVPLSTDMVSYLKNQTPFPRFFCLKAIVPVFDTIRTLERYIIVLYRIILQCQVSINKPPPINQHRARKFRQLKNVLVPS